PSHNIDRAMRTLKSNLYPFRVTSLNEESHVLHFRVGNTHMQGHSKHQLLLLPRSTLRSMASLLRTLHPKRAFQQVVSLTKRIRSYRFRYLATVHRIVRLLGTFLRRSAARHNRIG